MWFYFNAPYSYSIVERTCDKHILLSWMPYKRSNSFHVTRKLMNCFFLFLNFPSHQLSKLSCCHVCLILSKYQDINDKIFSNMKVFVLPKHLSLLYKQITLQTIKAQIFMVPSHYQTKLNVILYTLWPAWYPIQLHDKLKLKVKRFAIWI